VDPRSLRVYVLTSSGLVPGRSHRDVAEAALAGGATAVQLRAPELIDARLEALAGELVERCRATGTLFVVNDRVAVAASVGAGAHVGQGDDPGSAREILDPAAVLGVSVSTTDEARAAEVAGADYLGVTVWATPTKPEAEPRGLDGLRTIARDISLPVVGVGGIHAGNAADVLEAGAAGIGVVSAVGAAPDPVRATAELVEAVGRWEEQTG
jgi:thiamine-phosphate pyrophosphorylase